MLCARKRTDALRCVREVVSAQERAGVVVPHVVCGVDMRTQSDNDYLLAIITAAAAHQYVLYNIYIRSLTAFPA
jgi:hypothetical protein